MVDSREWHRYNSRRIGLAGEAVYCIETYGHGYRVFIRVKHSLHGNCYFTVTVAPSFLERDGTNQDHLLDAAMDGVMFCLEAHGPEVLRARALPLGYPFNLT